MTRLGLLLVAVVMATCPPFAAQQTPPAFEVASVKPNTSGATAQSSQIGNGSAVFTNIRMRALINSAYGIRPDRILGSPAWFDRERFDVTARSPVGTPDNQLRLMLRTLLAERFRLLVHSETREQPVYALAVARSDNMLGPNLKLSTECDASLSGIGAAVRASEHPCTVVMGSDGRGAVYLTGGARTIGAFVTALNGLNLQGLIDRPVVDRTGLTDTFDLDLRFAAAPLTTQLTAAPTLPDVFTAIEEQLGLKLQPGRGPVEMLVIDSVEMPTPN